MKEIYQLLTENEFKNTFIKEFYKDEILYSEGEECLNIGIVKKGKIKIASYLENGKEVIYNTLEKGEMFGNNLVFSSNPYFRGDVIAEEDSEIMLVSKKNLLAILQNNEEFLLRYLKEQSEFGKKLNLQLKLLTFNNAKERIIYYLEINNGTISYKSVTKLAKILFLSREVTSRTIHMMAANNEIKLEAKKIVKI